MFCPNCGTGNEEGARFCRNCGFDMMRASQNETPQQSGRAGGPSHAPKKNGGGMPGYAKVLLPLLLICILVLSGVLIHMLRSPAGGSGGSGKEASASGKKNNKNKKQSGSDGSVSVSEDGSTAFVSSSEDGGSSDDSNSGADVPETGALAGVIALARPSFYDGITVSAPAAAPSVPDYTVSPDLSNTDNVGRMYLSDQQTELLAGNGFFVVEDGGGLEFYEVYESNRYNKVPNFVTVDSMMHTYHLYFGYLLKKTEINHLSSSLLKLSQFMLNASTEQLHALTGTEWESAARRNAAFFGVGASLLDPSTVVDGAVSSMVSDELGRINAAAGVDYSGLFEEVMEDYSQYIPRGYYAGNETLERYFRAMMWYGRSNFTQSNEDFDRSTLLMTLAMDQGGLADWESIYTVTSFFAGASDDSGYYEYRPIGDAGYGADVTVSALPGNAAAWEQYHSLTALTEPPKINSVVSDDDGKDHVEGNKGFRFMGQRFSIDATIFTNLLYNKVKENSAGEKRMLPNALDIPAALGSDTALSLLNDLGETSYSGYTENMNQLRAEIAASDDTLWNASLYSQWLHTLRPLLDQKGAGYPKFMQTNAWARKSLQTFLGSYTELKHDTVLYAKQVMVEMGGGPEEAVDDRGYVEPEPVVFARLSALTAATSSGLSGYGLLDGDDASNLQLLKDLSDQLQVIAEKELRNETPTDAEFDLIRDFGGQLEHFWKEVYKNETTKNYISGRDFPAAIVTDVATDPNGQVLELGTGTVGEVYVVVPVDGSLRIATGGVYTFYQFAQPLSERLTDTAWREMMGIEQSADGSYRQDAPYETEYWTNDFQYSYRDLYNY